MKRAGIAALFAATALVFALPSASAQEKEEKKKVKSYDFTGDEIDGDLVKPDGDFIDPRKFATHSSLIRIRKDFIKEIIKSAEDL